MHRSVAVYRRQFLPPSETFIVDHITSLTRWQPVPICESVPPGGLTVPGGAPFDIHPPRFRRLSSVATTRFGLNPRLSRLVASRGISIIHAHFLVDAVRLARFARRAGLPLIATAHGFDASMTDEALREVGGGMYVDHRPVLVQAADMVICVSNFIRDQLLAKGFPPHKLLSLPLGVRPEQFSTEVPAGDRRGVLFVGRLVEKKGARFLLEAWRQLPPHLQEQGLNIIGEGPEEAALKALASQLPHVTFLGFRSRSEVRDLMTSSRMLAFPSLRAQTGDAEGMGIVAMEAQAMSMPVVMFDEGSAREVISPNETGFVVPPRDTAAYAAALEAILSSSDLASRLGAGARRHVEANFDLAKNTRRLEDVYDRVLESRGL